MTSQKQVFISFRGRDCRFGFVNYLKEELRQNNINVFTDEDAIRGKPLEELFKDIRKSRIALVIFSKHYADSDSCLNELLEIKKCMEVEILDAIPIFYKVEASHVRKQSGKFGDRFLNLQKDFLGPQDSGKKKKRAKSRIEKWKKSLVCVLGKIGLAYEKKSSEKEFIGKIVKEVKRAFDKIASEGRQNLFKLPSIEEIKKPAKPETLDVFEANNLGKLFHFSRPLEALNIERSNSQGGELLACLLSSMQDTKRLNMNMNMSSLEHLKQSNHSLFQMIPQNLEGLETHSPLDLIETAANWLALLMLTAQTHPALIFKNWDEMDPSLKLDIMYYARRKSLQITDELRRYNGSVDLKPVSWFMMLDHKLPRVLIETASDQTQVIPHLGSTEGSNLNLCNCETRKEREEDTTCFSFLCFCLKCCLCPHDEHETLRRRHRSSSQLLV